MKVTVKLSPEVVDRIELMKRLQPYLDELDQFAEDVLNERATALVEYDLLCIAAERRGISIARHSWWGTLRARQNLRRSKFEEQRR